MPCFQGLFDNLETNSARGSKHDNSHFVLSLSDLCNISYLANKRPTACGAGRTPVPTGGCLCGVPFAQHGWDEMRQRHFAGTSFEPKKLPENAHAVPTGGMLRSHRHGPDALRRSGNALLSGDLQFEIRHPRGYLTTACLGMCSILLRKRCWDSAIERLPTSMPIARSQKLRRCPSVPACS